MGTIAGLLCIWLASLRRSVTMLSGWSTSRCSPSSSFRSSCTPACCCSCSFFAANVYGWYAWSRQSSNHEAELRIRWLPRSKALGWLAACVVAIGLLTLFINPFFAFLTRIAVSLMQALGLQVTMPELQPDAFPFWDSCMTGAVGGGDDLNDPQVC